MKIQNKYPYFLFAVIMAFFSTAVMLSCTDDDPSLTDLREDKLSYIVDSLRISDSLRRINAAGVINYGVAIVDGATSSIFQNSSGSKTEGTQSAVEGAIVTISQFGKTMKDTTDASGIVVFNGFFRSAVTVTVEKTDYTNVTYISQLNIQASSGSSDDEIPSISFVSNMIPIFPRTGANTATISGVAKIQTDLTNKTRENAPDGTTVLAHIDATQSSEFSDKFLTTGFDNEGTYILVGDILQASYATGVVGSVTAGAYTITVPAAIDGLPLKLEYSEIAATQTFFESTGTDGQRTVTNRVAFIPTSTSTANIPSGSSVAVSFETFTTQAAATAVITGGTGALERIDVTAAGTGYSSANPPIVEINSPTGSGATGTAVVTNGSITAINLTSAGTGYIAGTTTVILKAGNGGTANAVLAADGTITGVAMINSGFGYAAVPTVAIAPPPGTGTTATAQATIDASGRVTISMLTFGSGYTAAGAPYTVTIGAPPAGGVQATATSVFSGNSVGAVTITGGGVNYLQAPNQPTVTFSLPQRLNGIRATGTAVVDASTGQITSISITNAGTGYTAAPTVAISSATGASATAVLAGGAVTQINVTNQGSGYTGTPIVIISGSGSGATATANLTGGKVTSITITNGGSGFTAAPTVAFSAGDNANAFASVTNGAISAITITDGGRNFSGAPRVIITSSTGGGATATATVAGGQITGVAVDAGGTGYLEGNTPAGPTGEPFSATKPTAGFEVKTGVKYINDIYFGTGTTRYPN